MKKLTLMTLFVLGLCTVFITNSCKKKTLNKANTTTEDDGLSESLFNDVGNISNEEAENDDQFFKTGTVYTHTCRKVTRSIVDSTNADPIWWTRRVVIDFGTTGCTGHDGRVRKGKITIEKIGKRRLANSSLTITLENYSVDGYKVDGTRKATNNGKNAAGNWTWTISVTNGEITTPDGKTILRSHTRTRELIAGAATLPPPLSNLLDDVYLITGSGTGTNREGRTFTVTITTPIRREVGCRWPVSGVIEIQPDDLKLRTIDFGDGTCDDEATVTVGKKSRTVHLKR